MWIIKRIDLYYCGYGYDLTAKFDANLACIFHSYGTAKGIYDILFNDYYGLEIIEFQQADCVTEICNQLEGLLINSKPLDKQMIIKKFGELYYKLVESQTKQ
jgi:hypothetical protein